MKIWPSTFTYLRTSLIAFLIAAALGVPIFIHLQNERMLTEQKLQRAHQHAIEAIDKLMAEQREFVDYYLYENAYRTLSEKNIIGDGSRLELIEKFEQLRQQKIVTDFKYRLSPQHPDSNDPLLNTLYFNVQRSTLTLQIYALHEGKFIHFLNALNAELPGLLIVNNCSIEKVRAASDPTPSTRLIAECEADWFNLKEKN